MPAPSAHLSPGNHLIVCGDTPLAYRLIRELTHRYHESVVVIIPGRLQNHGPRIAAISGITVLERAELTSAALREAGVATARAAAMVGWDDLANFHAALRAQELNPDLRIVVGADNRRLGDHITGLLRDCTVLSSSQLAGPALVAAALGEIAPSHVRVTGQTLYVARRGDVPGDHVLCGLAVTDDPGVAAQLVAPDDVYDDARPGARGGRRHPARRRRQGAPPGAGHAGRGRPVRREHSPAGPLGTAPPSARTARPRPPARREQVRRDLRGPARGRDLRVHPARLGRTGGERWHVLGGQRALPGDHGPDRVGADVAGDHGAEKVAQVLLTADGMALLPVVTALIVGARLTGRIRGEPKPGDGHVIVVGGGEVGVRVLGGLYDLGFHAVLIDQDQNARGVAFARNHRLPVVIGDSCDEKTLRHAGIKGAIAVISVTNNDIVNLETTLQARAMRGEELRVVLRLFDDDLAGRVQRTVGNVVSRSVSYLAAPTFAAAMLEHKVLRTIAVGRHVLLIADVRVEPGAGIAGLTLAVLERDRLARVLALQSRGELRYDWSPRRSRHLEPGDRIIVLATRAGLSTFLADKRPPVASP